MIGYTVVSVLCAFATSETMLIVLRGLQGFTDAMMFGTSIAIVTSVYPPQQRGRALGVTVASVYAGGALGPFLGGFLTQLAGWRSIFVLTAVLGLIVVALTLWKMRGEWAEARGQKMDYLGVAPLRGTLLGIMYGFRVLPSLVGFWIIAAGAVFLVLFVLRETRTASPVLDVNLFRRNAVVRLLQRGGAGQLRGDLRRGLSPEPLPPVRQGPGPAHGRSPSSVAARHDGRVFPDRGPASPTGSSRASSPPRAWP